MRLGTVVRLDPASGCGVGFPTGPQSRPCRWVVQNPATGQNGETRDAGEGRGSDRNRGAQHWLRKDNRHCLHFTKQERVFSRLFKVVNVTTGKNKSTPNTEGNTQAHTDIGQMSYSISPRLSFGRQMLLKKKCM